jgi:hypothetical protein
MMSRMKSFSIKSVLPLCAAILVGFAMLSTPQISLAKGCGASGAALQQGPKGGCFYINRNGNKTYVDRNCCH